MSETLPIGNKPVYRVTSTEDVILGERRAAHRERITTLIIETESQLEADAYFMTEVLNYMRYGKRVCIECRVYVGETENEWRRVVTGYPKQED